MKSIQVIATTPEGTRAAIEAAVPLAKGCGASLVVMVPEVIPYRLPADATPIAAEVAVEQYQRSIEALGGHGHVRVYMCPTVDDLIAHAIEREAMVVVGGASGRWRMSPEERFANRLSRAGHRVIFAATGCASSSRRIPFPAAAAFVVILACAAASRAQTPNEPQPVQYGGFVDVAALYSNNSPENHLFRNRGTTPRVNELNLNMTAAYVRKSASESSRLGFEATAQAGEDSRIFGFSATAPNMGGSDVLLHFGPINVSYLASIGQGLTIQGGIFSSLIGYDSLYAKDNFAYTRPWGADYTPYLMLGVNATYPVTPRLTLTGILVNGYWHLANANNVPSPGAQLAYKPSDSVTLKQSVLYGPHQAETSAEFWRILSDTIVERKTAPITTAFEYQFSTERVADAVETRAYWMSAQAPVHWTVSGPLSATVRPEIAWDSDGRWTTAAQTIKALTATLEYRAPFRGAQAIVRGEYRVDDSRDVDNRVRNGFFAGDDNHLAPTQHLFGVALILTFDGTITR